MKAFQGFLPALTVALMVLVLQANVQVQGQLPPTSPCTAAMLSSFNPCLGYLTNGNGTGLPTSDCCNSLKTIASNGTDCLCQIVTGGIPFRIPINRTMAVSLPKACKQSGSVPVQCKASAGAPVPAPGPAALTPAASASPSPTAGTVPSTTTPDLGPSSDNTPDLNPSTTGASVPPSSTTDQGIGGSTFNPSAAVPSFGLSSSVLMLPVVVMVMKYF